jgi:hypothetical protein
MMEGSDDYESGTRRIFAERCRPVTTPNFPATYCRLKWIEITGCLFSDDTFIRTQSSHRN